MSVIASDWFRGGSLDVQAILDAIDSLVVVLDLDGRVVACNRTCERSTGRTGAELRGRPIWEAFFASEVANLAQDAFCRGVRDGCAGGLDAPLSSRDGERRVIRWSGRRIVDWPARGEFVVATGEDVTEHRRAEEALRESERQYRISSSTNRSRCGSSTVRHA